MSINRSTLRLATGFVAALPALALAAPALAQGQTVYGAPVGATQVETSRPTSLPPLGSPTATAPASTAYPSFTEESFVAEDGVMTTVRTRRIIRSTPTPPYPGHNGVAHPGVYPGGLHPATPVVFEADQWIAECERRTNGRSEKEKGGIIGGLLGAIGGGILGNVVADSGDRLAGTLIGAGTGGLAGLLLGNLIGGGKKDGSYDCEAALDGYLSQYGQPGAPGFVGHATYPAGHNGYGQGYGYGCGCHQPIVYVPVRTTVRQRVVVTERVTETTVPGKPTKLIKTRPPVPVKYPSSPKLIKN